MPADLAVLVISLSVAPATPCPKSCAEAGNPLRFKMPISRYDWDKFRSALRQSLP